MKNFNHQPQTQPRLMNFGELREYFKEERPPKANGEWQPPYDPVFEATYKMDPTEQRKYVKDLQMKVYNHQMWQQEQGVPATSRYTTDGAESRAAAPRGTSRMRSNSYQVVKNNGSKYVRMQYGQKKNLVERAKQQGKQEFIEEIKYKATVTAIGIIALIGVGAAAYRPTVEAYNNATHAVGVAYENNVVKPIENFKAETGKKFEAAKESVMTLGGLIGEQEMISPLVEDKQDSGSEKGLESVEPATEEKKEVSAKTGAEDRNPAAATAKDANSGNTETNTAEAVSPDPEIPPFKYQAAIDKAVEETGTSHKEFHLLRLSENGGENLMAVNRNSNGTIDVGLFQDNVNPTDTHEIELHQTNPEYSAWKAGMKMKNRRNWLKDENLALAAYNKGASGAVNDPEGSLARVKMIYEKAGMEMPETEFTRNPHEFLKEHWDDFKSAGLNIPDKPPAAPKTASN